MNITVPNITITGQYTEVTVGSSVSINCTTTPPIPNSVIKWQSSSFNSDSNELIINPVMLSHNNKTFTCVVSSDLLIQPLTKNITLIVLSQLLHNTDVDIYLSFQIQEYHQFLPSQFQIHMLLVTLCH